MEEFSKLSKEEKKNAIYKYIMNENDKIKIYRFFKNLFLEDFEYVIIALYALNIKYNINSSIEQRYNFYYTFDVYNSLCDKFSKLANELHLENSLNTSILYTYLLWNGYFSINRSNAFANKDCVMANGLFSYDLFDGLGVCLNHSDLLKDLLNNMGYQSCNLLAKSNTKIISGDILIERNIDFSKQYGLIDRFLEKHVFTLIFEKDMAYIYDATNTSIYKIINHELCTIINGTGDYKIYPVKSYELNFSKDSINALNTYLDKREFASPYTESYFIDIFKKLLIYFKENIQLIEDYYKDSHTNISYLQSVVSDVKKIIKLC